MEELETPIELMQEKSQQPESTNSPTRPFSVRGTGAVPRCAHVACELKRSLLLVVGHVSTRRMVEGIVGRTANLSGDGGKEPSHCGVDWGAAGRTAAACGGVLGAVSGCDAREGDSVCR